MAQNLYTVEIKSLDQDIKNPTVGAGSANGTGMRLIFSQEAAAAFSDKTQVYLKGKHQQTGIQGYDAFKRVGGPPNYPQEDFYPQPGYYPPPGCYPPPPPHPYFPKGSNVWEIKGPRQMLREGDVDCVIELVDDISIYSTNNFIVHVLKSPHDGEHFIPEDDFTIFQEAIIALNKTIRDAKHMMRRMREQFSRFETEIDNISDIASGAKEKAIDIENRLQRHIEISDEEHETIREEIQNVSTSLTETINSIQNSLSDQIQNLSETTAASLSELDEKITNEISGVTNKVDEVENNLSNDISNLETAVDEKINTIKDNISTLESTVTEIQESTSDVDERINQLEQTIEETVAEATSITELI